jgi:hypothetical protein
MTCLAMSANDNMPYSSCSSRFSTMRTVASTRFMTRIASSTLVRPGMNVTSLRMMSRTGNQIG